MPRKALDPSDWAIRINGAVNRCNEITAKHKGLLQDFAEYQKEAARFRQEHKRMYSWEQALAKRARHLSSDIAILRARFTRVAEKLEIGAALLGSYADLDAVDKVLKRRKTKLRVRRHRKAVKEKKEANANATMPSV
jgi:hypothetical protein